MVICFPCLDACLHSTLTNIDFPYSRTVRNGLLVTKGIKVQVQVTDGHLALMAVMAVTVG